jgi:1-acyl-sn-glycerol-3-phosphate acyltransferase
VFDFLTGFSMFEYFILSLILIWLFAVWFVTKNVLFARRQCKVSEELVRSGKLKPEYLPFARTDFSEFPPLPILVTRCVFVGPIFLILSLMAVTAAGIAAVTLTQSALPSAVQFASKCLCFASGFRIREKGTRVGLSHAPCVVANHNSAFDIIVLLTRKFSFVSMDGVRDLPVIGKVASAMGCIFVARDSKNSREDAKSAIAARLSSQIRGTCPIKTPLVVFGEGSTNNGHFLLQFRRGAFEANVPIQPLRIEFSDFHLNYTIISLSELVCLACTLPMREITLHWLPVVDPKSGTPEELADVSRRAIATVKSAYGHPPMKLCDMSISHRDALAASDFIRETTLGISSHSKVD